MCGNPDGIVDFMSWSFWSSPNRTCSLTRVLLLNAAALAATLAITSLDGHLFYPFFFIAVLFSVALGSWRCGVGSLAIAAVLNLLLAQRPGAAFDDVEA